MVFLCVCDFSRMNALHDPSRQGPVPASSLSSSQPQQVMSHAAGLPSSGRRPLLLTNDGYDRHMLQNIRDNLSHVVQLQDGSTVTPATLAAAATTCRPHDASSSNGQPVQIGKPDVSQSAPNLSGATAERTPSAGRMTRFGYNKKALAQIRDSLRPYENTDLQSAYNLELSEDLKTLLHQLQIMGYDEVGDSFLHSLHSLSAIFGSGGNVGS